MSFAADGFLTSTESKDTTSSLPSPALSSSDAKTTLLTLDDYTNLFHFLIANKNEQNRHTSLLNMVIKSFHSFLLLGDDVKKEFFRQRLVAQLDSLNEMFLPNAAILKAMPKIKEDIKQGGIKLKELIQKEEEELEEGAFAAKVDTLWVVFLRDGPTSFVPAVMQTGKARHINPATVVISSTDTHAPGFAPQLSREELEWRLVARVETYRAAKKYKEAHDFCVETLEQKDCSFSEGFVTGFRVRIAEFRTFNAREEAITKATECMGLRNYLKAMDYLNKAIGIEESSPAPRGRNIALLTDLIDICGCFVRCQEIIRQGDEKVALPCDQLIEASSERVSQNNKKDNKDENKEDKDEHKEVENKETSLLSQGLVLNGRAGISISTDKELKAFLSNSKNSIKLNLEDIKGAVCAEEKTVTLKYILSDSYKKIREAEGESWSGLSIFAPQKTYHHKMTALAALITYFYGDKNGEGKGNASLITEEVLDAAMDGRLKLILEKANVLEELNALGKQRELGKEPERKRVNDLYSRSKLIACI